MLTLFGLMCLILSILFGLEGNYSIFQVLVILGVESIVVSAVIFAKKNKIL